MWIRREWLAVRLTAIGALCACADGPTGMSPGASGGRADGLQAEPAIQMTRVSSHDEEYERLVDSIPGFGGFFVDADGMPTVVLVDEGRSAQAALQLEGRLAFLRRDRRWTNPER